MQYLWHLLCRPEIGKFEQFKYFNLVYFYIHRFFLFSGGIHWTTPSIENFQKFPEYLPKCNQLQNQRLGSKITIYDTFKTIKIVTSCFWWWKHLLSKINFTQLTLLYYNILNHSRIVVLFFLLVHSSLF